MLRNDSVTDGQPQPRSMPHVLGRKKGIKYPLQVLFTDTVARVGKLDLDTSAAGVVSGGKSQASTASHGFRRVDNNVHKDPFHLRRVHDSHRQVFSELSCDLNIVK